MATTPKPQKNTTATVSAARLEVAKLAFVVSTRNYEMADRQLEVVRTRLSQSLGFCAAVVGVVMSSVGRSANFGRWWVVTIVAIGALLFVALCLVAFRLLNPTKDWARGIDAQAVLDNYLRGDQGGERAVSAYEHVAAQVDQDADGNRVKVDNAVKGLGVFFALAAILLCWWLLVVSVAFAISS